jgi:hypothetical protein
VPGVCCKIWWCMASVQAFPGVLPQVIRLQPSGPRVSWVRGYLDCTCMVLPVLHPRLSTRGRWRMRQSLRVRRSSTWRGCYMRHWPQSIRTCCARFGFVRKERQNLAFIPMASFMISHFSNVLFSQLLSRDSADVPMLLVEVTQAR